MKISSTIIAAISLTIMMVSGSSFVEASTPFETLASKVASPNNQSTVFQCAMPQFDCNNHGYCNRAGDACMCDDGWATVNCDASSQCCYRAESRVKMFLLSFFVSWTGATFFILGQVALGVAILLLCCCGLCCGTVGVVWSCGESHTRPVGVVLAVLGFGALAAAIIWSLANWIMYAAETEPWTDKNGVHVAPW